MKLVIHLLTKAFVGISSIWLCRAKIIDTWSLKYNRSTSYCSWWVETWWGRSGFHWAWVGCRRGPLYAAAEIILCNRGNRSKNNRTYPTSDFGSMEDMLRLCCMFATLCISRCAYHVTRRRHMWYQSLDINFLLGDPRSRPHRHYPMWVSPQSSPALAMLFQLTQPNLVKDLINFLKEHQLPLPSLLKNNLPLPLSLHECSNCLLFCFHR